MPFEQKGQTMTLTTDDPRHPRNTDDGLTGIKKQWVGGDEVIIQYNALMAAVKALKEISLEISLWTAYGYTARDIAREALAALRAAGIKGVEE
jgi:hypothetical protein